MKKIIMTVALVALATPAFAQETPALDKHEANQEERIQKGEENGSLTPKEAGHLEARETKLKDNEAAAKADGKVTHKERRHLRREARHDSKAIHHQKHDAQTAHAKVNDTDAAK